MGRSWQIGAVKIIPIVEIEDAGKVIQPLLADATRDSIRKIDWLRPNFADADGNLLALVQAFVIQTPKTVILVDTCVGNHKQRKDIPTWGNLNTNFLEKLKEAGYDRSAIKMVLCTHMHFDHLGWDTTREDGKWTPTFGSARRIFSKGEFEYWKEMPAREYADDKAGIADSLLPVFDAGLAELVEDDAKVAEEVSLIPTPGHTPHHVSILVQSNGAEAVITGDTLYHPCQLANPGWQAPDTDRAKA